MARKTYDDYIDPRDFPEEKLNPNRPHEYRKKHGVSPVGRIHEIVKEKKEQDPEGYAIREQQRREKISKTKSMQARTKEILNMTIKLSEQEQEEFLDVLKTSGEITVQDAMLFGQISKSIKYQATDATTFVRDTSGQKPKDVVEGNVTVDSLLKNNGILEDEED